MPEEVQAEIKSRDLLRARHVQELGSALQELLQAGKSAARDIVEGWGDKETMSDLEVGLQAFFEAREARLKGALDKARAARVKYNTEQARVTRRAMGSSCQMLFTTHRKCESSARAEGKHWQRSMQAGPSKRLRRKGGNRRQGNRGREGIYSLHL